MLYDGSGFPLYLVRRLKRIKAIQNDSPQQNNNHHNLTTTTTHTTATTTSTNDRHRRS
jgi:hypothetical protein